MKNISLLFIIKKKLLEQRLLYSRENERKKLSLCVIL